MVLTASNSANTASTLQVTFTVYVYCGITESYSGTTAESYTVGNGSQAFSFSSLSYTSSCSPTYSFTYSSTFANGTALPSFISFNPTTMQYTIDSNNTSLFGTYTIDVAATMNDPLHSTNDVFQWTINFATVASTSSSTF